MCLDLSKPSITLASPPRLQPVRPPMESFLDSRSRPAFNVLTMVSSFVLSVRGYIRAYLGVDFGWCLAHEVQDNIEVFR